MKRVSFLLAGVNLIFCNISGGHFPALLHICQYMYSDNDPGGNLVFKEADRHLLNFIWNGIFIPYNIAALVIFHTEGRNIFMAEHSFLIQYVLFVVAAYIGKLIYSKYSDFNGKKENGV